MLYYGECCKEKCIARRVKTGKDGRLYLVEYCTNKGCGWNRSYLMPYQREGGGQCPLK